MPDPSFPSPARALLALLGALLVLAPGRSLGEDRPLTLAEALEMADRRNPELGAARDRADAQAARAEGVDRMRWPRLALESRWFRTDNPSMVFASKLNAGEFTEDDFAISRLNSPEALSHLTTFLSLEAPLDVFGKVRAQSDGQAAFARAMTAGAREAAAELRLRVAEAYRRAELAGRAMAATERAVAGARAREKDVEARAEQGAALTADLLRARARRRQREADLAEQRGEERVALAGLARLLGAPPGATYVPVDRPPAPAPLEGDEAAWTARAAADRAVIEAAHQRREAGTTLAAGERKGALPDLAAFGQVQDDRNDFSGGGQSWAVGAVLRWAPFDGSRSRRLAAAEAESRAAAEDARAAEDQVRLEVETAWRRALAARERHAAAAGGAEEGREALRVVQERRQAGLATLTDELETEAMSLGAELEEMRAAVEVALADAALARAAGEN